MRRKHYHAIAGMHGCMPNMNMTCTSIEGAAQVLADTHEEARIVTALRRDRYAELNLLRDGNEYAEIAECREEGCFDE